MFDPLDLYSPENIVKPSQDEAIFVTSKETDLTKENVINNEDEEELPIDSLDLPSVYYASTEVILCILLLLKPSDQINFLSNEDSESTALEVCLQKGISKDLIKSTVEYYTIWGNKRLDTTEKLCQKIPTLGTRREILLNYYTLILKYYEKRHSPLKDRIIKEVSMRISENCGRTALPSMSRHFSFENLSKGIEIYEPSLTADNLGWKTWGSSFILSQKLINIVTHSKPTNIERVLELGSGTGLAGMAWLTKWIEIHGNSNIEMFFTDLKEIVPNLAKNIEINELSDKSIVDTLDWTKPYEFTDKYSGGRFNTIIVSDPIYSPNHPKLVVDVISLFLSSSGTCYLEIPLREKYAEERNTLWMLLEKNGLNVTNQENDKGMDDWGEVNYLYQRIQWRSTYW